MRKATGAQSLAYPGLWLSDEERVGCMRKQKREDPLLVMVLVCEIVTFAVILAIEILSAI